MKIALFGAAGNFGKRIVKEALARGHEVMAIVRDPAKIETTHERLTVKKGDVTNPASVAEAVKGYDVVISAIGPNRVEGNTGVLVDAAHSLIEGLKRAGVKRLIVVGGAGSLEVAPGMQLVDTPGFPAEWKPGALAHREALGVYRNDTDLDWTYISPAGLIEPSQRTGRYRVGTDQLVTDDKGNSCISIEDYAVALLDEVEHPKFIRRRFTVAY